MSVPPANYSNQSNQQMYGHQPMQRTMSSAQMNPMMHSQMNPTMMIPSSQSHIMNPPGYPQSLMNSGQQATQMNSAMSPHQPHMGSSPHMVGVSSMGPQCHGSTLSPHHHQGNISVSPVQVSSSANQQYLQHQQMNVGSNVSVLSSGPSSNNPQTPLTASMNPSSIPINAPFTPLQAPSSVQTSVSNSDSCAGVPTFVPPDPISIAKNLILKDHHKTLREWSAAGAELLRSSLSRQQSEASVASHNPMSANPPSANPQSVNPLSANPASVNSLDDPNSVEAVDKKTTLCPKEAYLSAFTNFVAVCDQIEMNFSLMQEAQRQCARFDKLFAGELKVVGDMANVNYAQYAQGVIDAAHRIQSSVQRSSQSLQTLMDRVKAAEHSSKRGTMEALINS